MKNKIKLFLIGLTFLNGINAQNKNVTISGTLVDEISKETLPFVNVVLQKSSDSSFVGGTITSELGLFTFDNIAPSEYQLTISFVGYNIYQQSIYIGGSSPFLSLGTIELSENVETLGEVIITTKQDEIGSKMDKKSYAVENNIAQSGGSILQAMENLPGITIQDNKVQLRGSDKIVVLIDGKQSALTGFGSQSGLDNIPASSIEKIEIINNPSSKYDANGNAGIINIILKKNKNEGLNGKIGIATGLGALWVKRENLPTIRPQYQFTPKINPSIAMNYRKEKINLFFQFDNLYTQTLNKNEFITRTYDNGNIINQQTKRNRNTNFMNSKAGLDWFINENNQFTVSGIFGAEKIIDRGDQPFFNSSNTERLRLWQFVEDELKTTIMANTSFQHKFKEPGRILNTGVNYTFHRENEQYFFDNILPNYQGQDAFKLLSDEHVLDFNLDYSQPFKHGKFESGMKMRVRNIPTNMQFFPSAISPLDTNAGGQATYKEIIPAIYGNYLFENKKWEGELGLRLEYMNLQYQVNPNHNTYKSDGYNYFQPFPNMRLAYKMSEYNRISLFYNRRVDRPNEVDIRIFPKYDDAEIIKVGNPSLKPQYTNTIELGFKHAFEQGYWYSSLYSRFTQGTITRISTITNSSTLIYAVFQNAGNSNSTGIESVFSYDVSNHFSYNLGVNVYYNQINAFTINTLYPKPTIFSSGQNQLLSGNAKLNTVFHLPKGIDIQSSAIYLAPDIIPQGKIKSRFTLNLGVKKTIWNSKGELFLNASDLLNTMVIRKEIQGNGFSYQSSDYYETQVVRVGFNYKF